METSSLVYVLQERTLDITPQYFQGWRDVSESHSKSTLEKKAKAHNDAIEPGHEHSHRVAIQIR